VLPRPSLPIPSHKSLICCNRHQPPQDHLLGPGSACNCSAIGTLQTGYPYAQDLSRVPRRQTPPPGMGGLWRHHMSHGTRPRLPAWVGSGVTACPMAPDPATRHGRALASPRVSWHQTPPPDPGGLWRHHVSHGTKPHLPAREGSGVTMCLMATYPTSRHGGLWRRHVPRLSTWEGSGITMCPMAPSPPPREGGLWCCHVPHGSNPPSQHGRALVSPHAAWCQVQPPDTGGLRRHHVPPGSQRAMSHKQMRNTQPVY
jgi:hypothetical protein